MSNRLQKSRLTRRSMLRSAAAAAMFGPLFKATEGSVSAQEKVNRNSAPSGLKITDMRACRVAANYDYPLIKVYTNQDVYGLGEVRDAGVEGIALVLKPYLVGRNPLEIDRILHSVRPFAGSGRMSGGFSAVDMALHDIAGKVHGVPAYRLIGEKNAIGSASTRTRRTTRIPKSTRNGCGDARIWGSLSSKWICTPA